MTLAKSLFSVTDSKYQAREHQNPHFETVTENNDLAGLPKPFKSHTGGALCGVEEGDKSIHGLRHETRHLGFLGICEKALENNAF